MTATSAIELFNRLIETDRIERITQRGRDYATARFTIHLTDGTRINLGAIDNLWSQTTFAKTMLVTAGIFPKPVKANDWREAIGGLIAAGVEVEDTPGETLEETVREWAAAYAANASNDADGAAGLGQPYRQNGHVYLKADKLAAHLHREYGAQVSLPELRHSLAAIGFERITVHCNRGTTRNPRRGTVSYYRATNDVLEPPEP